MFGELTDTTVAASAEHTFLFLVVDLRCLQPGSVCLADIASETGVQPATPAADTLRALYTLVSIANESHLGTPSTAENVKEKRGQDLTQDAVKKTHECMVDLPDGTSSPIVRIYVEFARNTRKGTLALRFVFQALKPGFCFDVALMAMFRRHAAMQHRPRMGAAGKTKPAHMQAYTTQAEWIRYALSSYTNESFLLDEIKTNDANKVGLEDPRNPARAHKIFTFGRSQEILQEIIGSTADTQLPRYLGNYFAEATALASGEAHGASAKQSDVVTDNGEDDDEEDEEDARMNVTLQGRESSQGALSVGTAGSTGSAPAAAALHRGDFLTYKLRFPFHALRVPLDHYNPDTFFKIACHEYPEAVEDRAAKIARLRDQKRNANIAAEPVSAVDIGSRYYARLREESKKSPDPAKAMFHEIQSPASIQVFTCAMADDNECPAAKAAYQYVRDKLAADSNWTAMRPIPVLMDSTLTDLGNFIAHDLVQLEHMKGVECGHQEVLFLLLASLDAGEMSVALRIHVGYSGPPQAGKSFVFQVYEELSLQEAILRMSSQSKQSMTTTLNVNGRVIIFDEVGNMFMSEGDDGSGSSIVKEILTRGMAVTEMCYVDHDVNPPIRKTTMTTTVRKCQHWFGMNPGFRSMAPAIRTRVAKFFLPLRHRSDVDAVELTSRMNRMESAVEGQVRLKERWHIIQFVAYALNLLIRMQAIPAVDRTMTEKLTAVACQYLKSRGIDVDIRDKERVHFLSRAICMYYAINQVFFTTRHFKAGTPFDFKQIFACVPYLTCTREQFSVAFSELFPSFVNPFVNTVLQAVRDAVDEAHGDKRYSRSTEGSARFVDENYYWLDVNSYMTPGMDAHKAVQLAISQRISGDGILTLSPENVGDVIHWLEMQMTAKTKYPKRKIENLTPAQKKAAEEQAAIEAKALDDVEAQMRSAAGGGGQDVPVVGQPMSTAQNSPGELQEAVEQQSISATSVREKYDDASHNPAAYKSPAVANDDIGHRMHVARVHQYGMRNGLEISRGFMEVFMKMSLEELLENCLMRVADVKPSPLRYALGLTLRAPETAPEQLYKDPDGRYLPEFTKDLKKMKFSERLALVRPHLSRCFAPKPEKGRTVPFEITNDADVPLSCEVLCMLKRDISLEQAPAKITSANIDTLFKERWWTNIGYEFKGLLPNEALYYCQGEYPHKYEQVQRDRAGWIARRAAQEAKLARDADLIEAQKKLVGLMYVDNKIRLRALRFLVLERRHRNQGGKQPSRKKKKMTTKKAEDGEEEEEEWTQDGWRFALQEAVDSDILHTPEIKAEASAEVTVDMNIHDDDDAAMIGSMTPPSRGMHVRSGGDSRTKLKAAVARTIAKARRVAMECKGINHETFVLLAKQVGELESMVEDSFAYHGDVEEFREALDDSAEHFLGQEMMRSKLARAAGLAKPKDEEEEEELAPKSTRKRVVTDENSPVQQKRQARSPSHSLQSSPRKKRPALEVEEEEEEDDDGGEDENSSSAMPAFDFSSTIAAMLVRKDAATTGKPIALHQARGVQDDEEEEL